MVAWSEGSTDMSIRTCTTGEHDRDVPCHTFSMLASSRLGRSRVLPVLACMPRTLTVYQRLWAVEILMAGYEVGSYLIDRWVFALKFLCAHCALGSFKTIVQVYTESKRTDLVAQSIYAEICVYRFVICTLILSQSNASVTILYMQKGLRSKAP